MILDFLSQCTSVVKCTNYNSLNGTLLTDNYTIKSSEMLSWRLSSPTVSSVEFRFLSPTTKKLKNILYELKGGELADYKVTIETSIDYSNWYELKFKTDDKYIYAKTNNGFINLTTKVVTADINLNYAFLKINEFNNQTEYLYNDLEFKFIRLTITPIEGQYLPASEANPLFFSNFNIYVDDEFDENLIDYKLLEIKSEIFTRQKMFEENEFFPDLIKNYMMMLEDSAKPLRTLNKSDIVLAMYNYDDAILNYIMEHGIEFDEIEFTLLVY